ncbi:MAG: hypothetical protein HUJ29_05055 [Gammaproteobacteria bacterium]|nr:hypothetical protein [Gammaproteobacteria bacterium]
MYQSSGHETLLEVTTLPRPYRDAPLPIILADELNTILCYVVGDDDAQDASQSERLDHYEDEPMLAVKFHNALAHYQGPPDDGGIQGHPLYAQGLRADGIYVVENSNWLQSLKVMQINSGLYNASDWEPLKHYVFSFHSMTFECIAEGYRSLMVRGPLRAVFDSYTEILDMV